MTKEEAMDYINISDRPEEFGSFPEMAKHTVSCFVRDIYDDFESRTCENCKHYQYLSKENGGTSRNMPYYMCLNENDIMPDADGGWLEPYKDFGCNQWESGND